MDLQEQITISPTGKKSPSPGNHIDRPKQLSLFEAVRMWTNDEGIPFDIVDAGNRLTQANPRNCSFGSLQVKAISFRRKTMTKGQNETVLRRLCVPRTSFVLIG